MVYDYPAIFFSDSGSIGVRFYDADWYTCGDDMSDAIEMAEDILGGRLMRLERDGGEIPKASKLEEVELKPNETVRMIHVDTEVYARELEEELRRRKINDSENPIKAARESFGLSIKDLANILGAPYRTVQDWNSGKHKTPEWLTNLIVEKIEKSA